MRSALSALSAVAALAACTPAAETDAVRSADPAAVDSSAASDAPPAAAPANTLISADGVGPFRAAGTLADFMATETTAQGRYEPYYMVDFSAWCFAEDAEDLACGMVFFSETPQPGENVLEVHTESSRYRTAEGVGPGMSLANAETAYGEATLNFSYDNEGREYVAFANAPAWFSARPGGAQDRHVGVYPESAESYHETSNYAPDATVWQVAVRAPWSE